MAEDRRSSRLQRLDEWAATIYAAKRARHPALQRTERFTESLFAASPGTYGSALASLFGLVLILAIYRLAHGEVFFGSLLLGVAILGAAYTYVLQGVLVRRDRKRQDGDDVEV